MDLNASTVWWLVTGALVAAELTTGTFYLLMVALGAVAGALAAHAGLPLSLQWVTAAVVGAGTTMAWHFKRQRQPGRAPAAQNKDVNIDIGQALQVDSWGADGTARVAYRGSSWAVRLVGGGTPMPGPHVIVSVHSGHLGVSPQKHNPQAA
jgi:membrane protein implicated in regulation of membrane protease activity